MQTFAEDPTRRQITINGHVVREDGTVPPFGIMIERDCGGGYRNEAYTEVSGYFSFQIGHVPLSNELPADPRPADQSIWRMAMEKRVEPPQFEVNLCMLRARLPGYRSSIVQISGDPGAAEVDVGTIVLYPNKKSKNATVSLTGLSAPKEARKAVERARLAIQKSELKKAAADLKKALSIHPKYPEAWYLLGHVDERLQLYREAEEAFHKAVALDASYVSPFLGLATAAWRRQDWADMMDWSARCLKLEPLRFPEAYLLNAVALYRMNMLDAAEETARKGAQVDTTHRAVKIHLVLAEIFYSKKNFSGSIQEMRNYLQFARRAPDAEEVRAVIKTREEAIRITAAQ